MADKTINTRIQLKNDTEENWRKAGPKGDNPGFIPRKGELIIYNAETGANVDEARRFPRFKVGDGVTTVVNLPFTTRDVIQPYATYSTFPAIGQTDTLYIDLSTNKLYYYVPSSGYLLFSTPVQIPEYVHINAVTGWNSGTVTTAAVNGYDLKIDIGTAPTLNLTDTQVVTSLSIGESSEQGGGKTEPIILSISNATIDSIMKE